MIFGAVRRLVEPMNEINMKERRKFTSCHESDWMLLLAKAYVAVVLEPMSPMMVSSILILIVIVS